MNKLMSIEEYNYLKSLSRKAQHTNTPVIRIETKKPRNKYDPNLPKEYKQYLKRATDKKLAFEYTIEEFMLFIQQDCEYCNTPNANGIDRIHSNKGYTKDNCVPCCTKCNTMKFTYRTEDFLLHIKSIYLHNFNPL